MRNLAYLLLVVSAAALLFFALRPRPSASDLAAPTARGDHTDPPAAVTSESATGEPPGVQELNMVADLNAANRSVRDDLLLLESVFQAWQSNFPKEGNPVGTNAEITAALTGKNSLGLAYVPSGHPAINKDGELCDRWGTPFFFHQLSGSKMQILSAGPDKRRGTADDVTVE